MALTLTLPQINSKSSTKDYAITILGYDWPLPVKRIYNLIKKRFGHNVTYQAVFKTVKELHQQGVLEKTAEGYQINLKWLRALHTYTELVESNYYTKNRLNLIEGIKDARKDGNINVITFRNLFDVEKYIYYLQKHYILSASRKEVICVHHLHEWRPLFYLRAEYNWIRTLLEKGHRTYVLCSGNTAVDRFCTAFYRNIGCNILSGINCANPAELMVFNEFLIQIYLPNNIRNNMEVNFNKITDLGNIDHNMLIREIFEKEDDIQVIINKDMNLCSQIRESTLQHFLKIPP